MGQAHHRRRSCLCQLPTHRRCRNICLHLRRRPLSSRPGSKGAVPSAGRAALPEHIWSKHHRLPRRRTSNTAPLHASHPQTSPSAAAATHQDASFRMESPEESAAPTKLDHLLEVPRRRLHEGNDAKTPPPPNPRDLGFSPGSYGEERGGDEPLHRLQGGQRRLRRRRCSDRHRRSRVSPSQLPTSHPNRHQIRRGIHGQQGSSTRQQQPPATTPEVDGPPRRDPRPPPPRRPCDQGGRPTAPAHVPCRQVNAALSDLRPPPQDPKLPRGSRQPEPRSRRRRAGPVQRRELLPSTALGPGGQIPAAPIIGAAYLGRRPSGAARREGERTGEWWRRG